MKDSDHCEIPLGRNGQHVTLVSAEDYTIVARWRWNWKRSQGGNIYARRGGGRSRCRTILYPTILLHVVICELAHGPRPSEHHTPNHKNHNPLDNRRSNLEWATPSEQARHQRRRRPKTEGETHVPF